MFETTPNPDALKCNVACGAPAEGGGGLRSYDAQKPPSDDPLAAALLAIEGVAGVLIMPTFLTVRRTAGAAWPGIKREIKRVLSEHGLT